MGVPLQQFPHVCNVHTCPFITVGHGPFSHLFDGKFIPKVLPESKWKVNKNLHFLINIVQVASELVTQHEVASEMMLDHLIEENGLMEEMRKYGLNQNDVDFIKELIGPGKNEKNETPTRHV